MTRKEPHKSERGDSREKLDPRVGEITHALLFVELPQDKQGLLVYAEENDADEEMIRLLEQIPDVEYETMADIVMALTQIDDGEEPDDERPLYMGDDEEEDDN